MEIASQKRGFDGSPQCNKCPVGGMLRVVAGEATQDRLRLSGASAQGGSIPDHIVIVLADQCPVDGLGQNRLQVGRGIDIAGMGPRKLL